MGTSRPALLVLLLGLVSCVQSDPVDAPEGEVMLTLERLVEDILPDAETTVEIEVTTDGGRVFSETYPVAFDGSDYVATLGTVELAAALHDVRASILSSGDSCSEQIDLTPGVDVTVGSGSEWLLSRRGGN